MDNIHKYTNLALVACLEFIIIAERRPMNEDPPARPSAREQSLSYHHIPLGLNAVLVS